MAWTVRSAQPRIRSGVAALVLILISACQSDKIAPPLPSNGNMPGKDAAASLARRSVCDPCSSSSQCAGAQICAAIGKPAGSQGLFCVYSCAGGAVCLPGYHCDTASTADGKPADVCLPDGDSCACTAAATVNVWTTPCFRAAYDTSGAPIGQCTGMWLCGATGGACDALQPVAETCNGKDDDCDGQTDEGDPCDDGVSCTTEGCSAGVCTTTANHCGCQSDAECPSVDLCADKLVCDKSKSPATCELVPGSAVKCQTSPDAAKDAPCGQKACDPKTGQCLVKPGPDGTPCNADDSECSQGDACKDGKCLVGKAVGCDDGNPCTVDTCDDKQGCQHSAGDGGACDLDSSACTADVCQGGKCTAGVGAGCDDQNPCTEDKCDAKTGQCGHDAAPLLGKACDDGDGCSEGDACTAGTCAGAAKACDDGNPCTDDSCVSASGCVHAANTAGCDDGDACTGGDACKGGKCLGGAGVCECQSDAECAQMPGTNPCLGKLTCTANKCAVVPGTVVTCDAKGSGPCTQNACHPATGQCAPVLQPDGKACDDGSACTSSDGCKAGGCAGQAVSCDDGNSCTTESCDAKVGCKHAPNTAACDADGNGCTGPDACQGGICKPGSAKACDDGNPCTTDGCDGKTGTCMHDGPAMNGKACPGNACGPASCAAGKCVAASDTPCNDGNPCTDDSCDALAGCKHTANAAACDDGDACSTSDVCSGGACKAGAAVKCDDANVCTTDACAKASGCTHAPATGACDDKDACTSADACKNGACVGTAKSCNDANPCTLDKCTAGKCSSDSAAMDATSCTPPPNCKGPGVCKSAKCGVPDGACSGMESWPPVVPAKFAPAQQLFDPVGFHVIQITLSASVWKQYLAAVAASSQNASWYPADVTVDGIVYTGVGIRKFGYGSMLDNPQKPNIRVGFDQYTKKYGPEQVKNLRLKSSGQDRTFLRQPLAQVFTQQLGGYAPRFSWARVQVNGENYGLYQVFEQADKRMFSVNFGNNDGDKYESINGCVGLNCPGGSCSAIKYEYQGDPGLGGQIVALAKAAHDGTSTGWAAQAAAIADMPALMAYYAVESVISDLDGLPAAGQNFTIYAHEVTKLLEFIPTGPDLSFGNFFSWYDLFQPWGAPNTWCMNHQDDFFLRILKTPELKNQLTGLWKQLRCGAMANSAILPLIDQYKAMLKQDLYYDPKGQATQAEIDNDFSQLKKYISNRNAAIANELGSACP